jgi:hypothetical protein
MENIFSMFMSQMSQAGHESTGLKEALELYKTRGKKPSGRCITVLTIMSYSWRAGRGEEGTDGTKSISPCRTRIYQNTHSRSRGDI